MCVCVCVCVYDVWALNEQHTNIRPMELQRIPYLATFSMLMEHFQMAPVVAASSCLLSALLSRDTSGFRPWY